MSSNQFHKNLAYLLKEVQPVIAEGSMNWFTNALNSPWDDSNIPLTEPTRLKRPWPSSELGPTLPRWGNWGSNLGTCPTGTTLDPVISSVQPELKHSRVLP